MKKLLLLLPILFLFLENLPAQNKGRQEQYLQELLPFLQSSKGSWASKAWLTPLDSTWESWQKRTGELPPDFEQLPASPLLVDPLNSLKTGKKITSPEAWQEQRKEMSARIQHWLSGTFPPQPDNLSVGVMEERWEGEIKVQRVEISWQTDKGQTLSIKASLYYPPGKGPFPVFMTPGTKGHSWISITQALSRGYLCVQYSACDAEDDTEAFGPVYYPEYDFTTIMRRAWGAHRVIDYLYDLDEVDKEKIGITGLSRDGKQVFLAAAFDERINAVVVCSGGTGGEDPFRFTDPKYDNETLAAITANFPHWLHPRLRFFAGREHQLPFDQHFLSALIAPRGLMLSSSFFEDQGNPWGIEQHFDAAKPVFDFLGAGDRISLHLRRGLHRPAMRDVHTYVDFFDTVFGRKTYPVPVIRYYDYSFEKWKTLTIAKKEIEQEEKMEELLTGNQITLTELKTKTAMAAKKLIGEPSMVLNPSFRAGLDYLDQVIRRPGLPDWARSRELHLGQLQYPTDSLGQPLKNVPVVIYLHEFAYPTGYGRGSWRFVHALLKAGFAVYLQDQIGFGSRVEEGKLFYHRYPKLSKLGAMVSEFRLAIDALEGVEFVNPDQIYAVGYSLGAKVGIWSAPFEDRLAGMVAIAGFTPLRSAGNHPDISGVRSYSHLHGLIPKLGFYIGEEASIPVDYPELLSSFAPKPLLLIAPKWDRDAKLDEVTKAVEVARATYEEAGAKNEISLSIPNDFNQFSTSMENQVLEWLKDQLEK